MASVYRRTYKDKRTGKKKRCKTYTIELSNGKRIKGYTDKFATEQKAAEIERTAARGEQNCLDLYADHRNRPIKDHVKDYIADLREMGRDPMYVYSCEKRLHKLIEDQGWSVLGDIDADSFCRWREKATTIGPVTKNQYLKVVRFFCGWCIGRKRLAKNPMDDAEKVDETADVRRARRALSEEELERLMKAVPKGFRLAYRFMLGTGLRRQEAADLVWGDVKVDAPHPFLQLRARATKARRADVLPLRADLVSELKKARKEAGDAEKVFAVLPTIEEHKAYLKKAKIPWEDGEKRRADIHSLRHTFGTLLAKSGVPVRVAMELMRHSDIKQTVKVYTDPRLFDLAGAVAKLPLPKVQEKLKPTGTEGKS